MEFRNRVFFKFESANIICESFKIFHNANYLTFFSWKNQLNLEKEGENLSQGFSFIALRKNRLSSLWLTSLKCAEKIAIHGVHENDKEEEL